MLFGCMSADHAGKAEVGLFDHTNYNFGGIDIGNSNSLNDLSVQTGYSVPES